MSLIYIQLGSFLVHCLNVLVVLLRNDIAFHLQSGCQCVGEGAEVFREELKGRGVTYVMTVVKLIM